ncbi:MAG: hypothetical protein KBC88_06960 [Alphaproteobacteria bacterium]|jgi:hypothetical protein|nr:hypothetical protein [Alphaproteobacteria bacterium]
MLRFLLLAFLFIPFDAKASCIFKKMPDTEIHVLDSVAARHVRDGVLTGCLLKLTTKDSGGESMQAYTPYDFICDLPKNEQLKVSFGQSCCDAGDEGDFNCGVKPINPFAFSYYWVSISIVPSVLDRRAIPSLLTMLEKETWRSAQLVDHILQYHKAFPAEISALRPEFERIHKKATEAVKVDRKTYNIHKAGAMARLMHELYGDTFNSDELLEADVAIFTNGLYSVTDDQHAALTRITKAKNLTVEQFALLVDRLRNTDRENQGIVLDALGHFPQYLPSHLNQIRNHLPDKNYYGSNPKPEQTALRESLLAEWQKLVCLAFPPREGETFRQIVFTQSNYGSDPLLVTCSADAK